VVTEEVENQKKRRKNIERKLAKQGTPGWQSLKRELIVKALVTSL